jgi:predicted metalloprotease with PDZ domain
MIKMRRYLTLLISSCAIFSLNTPAAGAQSLPWHRVQDGSSRQSAPVRQSAPPRSAAPASLRYELRFEKPNTHLVDVTIHDEGLNGRSVEFAIPDWAPGSYYIMNYSAEVQGFHAADSSGHALTWRKTDSQTWRVELTGAKSITIQYQVYGNTLINNLLQYNDRHVFFGGPAVWMYQTDGKERPIQLTIRPPAGRKIATGMHREPSADSAKSTGYSARDDSSAANESSALQKFSARNYDIFADCPFEISAYAEKTFVVKGTTYHVIVHDVENQADFSQFAADLQKIVASIVPMWAPVTGTPQPAPFKDYWFIFHIWPHTNGGLEHLNSTQIDLGSGFDDPSTAGPYHKLYDSKLFVSAHEFFHAWNVKRLRPLPLGPFDYTREVHTPSLWISEGLTSYYADLTLARAGLVTPQQYLDRIALLITSFEQLPGRRERSIEDTSWDTWYTRLKTENNLNNTSYSYYDGGQLVGHLLDFAIRHDTGNQKSLDDWMRLLYSRYALPKPGFEPGDAVHAASETAGTNLSDFFQRYISGKEALPYDQYFAYAGIAVTKEAQTSKPWMGISQRPNDSGQLAIDQVIPRSPAEAAGLSKDDIIAAVDGRIVDEDHDVGAMIGAKKPGDTIRISVWRDGELREFDATLRPNPYFTYSLKPMSNPTPEQQAAYKSWLGLK